MSSSNNNEVISKASPHTIKKFELIEAYVQTWAHKLLEYGRNTGNCNGIVFIDCMCNSGMYIKLTRGHMYLTAIIDWYSRRIMGWELSDSLETAPVLSAVLKAVETYGIPAIINSDQGSQFTSDEYKQLLHNLTIAQSMDGKSRWADNIMIERWFRSLKCDKLYVTEYRTPRELRQIVREYIGEYNTLRPHEALDYKTPDEVFFNSFGTAA